MTNIWSAKILTSIPETFPGPLNHSIIGNALKKKIWDCETFNLKYFSTDKHHTIDDTPYGGGPGMIIKPDIVEKAVNKAMENMEKNLPLVYMTPAGEPLSQKKLEIFSKGPGIIILCGRFEGVDERVLDAYNFERISVGDYILAGGEIAAMNLIEGCVRLLPGVVGKMESLQNESFNSDLLEYPQYTKPKIWFDEKHKKSYEVPDILLAGNHQKISEWRKKQSIIKTKKYRPELL